MGRPSRVPAVFNAHQILTVTLFALRSVPSSSMRVPAILLHVGVRTMGALLPCSAQCRS